MKKKSARDLKPAVTNVEMAVLFAHFSLLINLGRPVMEVLKTMAMETRNPALNKALIKIHDGCGTGKNLGSQMREFPEIFTPTSVLMINAGEISGTLDTYLENLAAFYQKIVLLEKGV